MIPLSTLRSASVGRPHRFDRTLLVSVVILLVASLIIMYSISPVLSHKLLGDVNRNYYLYRQFIHVGLGLIGFLIVSRLSWQRWQGLLPGLVILCGLSLLFLMVPATAATKNGATRWVEIGGFSYQPAELIKLTVILFLAKRFATSSPEQLNSPRFGLWSVAALLGILAIFVVIFQRDLGTMLVIASIIMAMFFSSGVGWGSLWQLLAMGIGFGTVSILLFPHRLSRLTTFFNPDANLSGAGYHINQALIAIGSGGLFGLGLGKSIQVYGYLPEAANDSIFAIIAETFGFFGSVLVLGLLALLTYRCFKVAQNAPDRFSQFVSLGVAIWIGSQSLVNVMAMLGLIPLTGVPMPFISYGGTSLFITMVALGIVANISKYTRKESYANRPVRRRNGRSYNPALGYRQGT